MCVYPTSSKDLSTSKLCNAFIHATISREVNPFPSRMSVCPRFFFAFCYPARRHVSCESMMPIPTPLMLTFCPSIRLSACLSLSLAFREIFLRASEVISKVPTDGSPASEPRVVEAFRAFADK